MLTPALDAAAPDPIRVDTILGVHSDAAIHDQLHDLAHQGRLDVLRLPVADLPRRRVQARTEAGRLVQIVLPRDQKLVDGAVLWMDRSLAVVLRVREQPLLRLTPRSLADALALGHLAGTLHWTVRFVGEDLLVTPDTTPDACLARLGPLAEPGRLGIEVVQDVAEC